MKCRYMLMAVLVSGLVSLCSVRAEDEKENAELNLDRELERLELDNKQLDFQERQSEFEFKNEMRKMELEKAKVDLDKQRQMLKMQAEMGQRHLMGGPAGREGRPEGPRMGEGRPEGHRMGPGGPGRPEGPMMDGRGGPCGPSGCPLMGGPGGIKPPCHKRGLMIFILVTGLIHVMLAMWVYQDIRKRSMGSGVWILLVLLVGFVGALVYAIVRIGDKQESRV